MRNCLLRSPIKRKKKRNEGEKKKTKMRATIWYLGVSNGRRVWLIFTTE